MGEIKAVDISLKPIKDLLGIHFFIPNYQRGFRWKKQQVKDLLDDIDEFINKQKCNHSQDNFYCLQPLVVKETVPKPDNFINALPREVNDGDILCKVKKAINENTRWEVIDGQQRLTTIYILLTVLNLNEKCYDIEYETRNDSKNFLSNISNIENEAYDNNIDYHHIVKAKNIICEWFLDKNDKYKQQFNDILLNKVQFIWYKSDEDPIRVFTRLNIGKIGLTNAELIKALFLNRSNFAGEDYEKVRLKQYEIASQWDRIEYTLQNEEFWLFLHDTGYTNPTRIDFIFDLMCDMGKIDSFIGWNKNDKENNIGTDKYRTFRYFNAYFHSDKAKEQAKNNNITLIEQCWAEVSNIFQTFEEWFNDLELYHYIGYLIDNGSKLNDILIKWDEAKYKKAFFEDLINDIKKKIDGCKDLSQQYEIDGKSKTACKPLLLLHNIQTVILQNKNSIDNYKLGVFYKFPFHLYKIEKWDVEHIDSNTENDLSDTDAQNEFLLNVYNGVSSDEQKNIGEFINKTPNANANTFDKFKKYKNNNGSDDKLDDKEKNQIWNFTLLDSSTNRSYGNSIFSAKRRIIIGKDKGKLIPIPKIRKKNNVPDFYVGDEKDAQSSFIPPCTKQVFLKYYSSASTSPNYWGKSDAEAYQNNIFETLRNFGVINPQDNSTKKIENGK